jgi:hypothetical protein
MSDNNNNHRGEDVGPIFKAVAGFFKEDGWNYEQLEGRPILRMGFQGENGNWACFAQSLDEKDRFVFYSSLEMRVPANKRAVVAEYLTRANYGMIIGNFEMDFADGEVRFRTSVDIEGGELTREMIKNLAYSNVLMMDRYLPGLMSVVYAGATPAEAIEKAEA